MLGNKWKITYIEKSHLVKCQLHNQYHLNFYSFYDMQIGLYISIYLLCFLAVHSLQVFSLSFFYQPTFLSNSLYSFIYLSHCRPLIHFSLSPLLSLSFRRGLPIQESFEHFDVKKVGYIDCDMLVDGLARLGIGVVYTVAEHVNTYHTTMFL